MFIIYKNMISTRVFQALVGRSALSAAPITAMQSRSFLASKKKGGKKGRTDASASEAEFEESVAEPVAQKAAPVSNSGIPDYAKFVPQEVSKDLFKPFSLGEINQVQSTPDNKPPPGEDSLEGRYAGVLFSTASQKEALFDVYEDMMYLSELHKHSESFRLFTENAGVGLKEITQLNEALLETAPFHPTTIHFLTVLAENKRLYIIAEIAQKYKKLYSLFNKEEKITIISAENLSASQQDEVLAALRANPNNEGKAFTLEYKVDAAIQGGLQMYTESEFMDMSLQSRMSRINEEVAKLTI
jgi:ATP synthase F1 delta subunit